MLLWIGTILTRGSPKALGETEVRGRLSRASLVQQWTEEFVPKTPRSPLHSQDSGLSRAPTPPLPACWVAQEEQRTLITSLPPSLPEGLSVALQTVNVRPEDLPGMEVVSRPFPLSDPVFTREYWLERRVYLSQDDGEAFVRLVEAAERIEAAFRPE